MPLSKLVFSTLGILGAGRAGTALARVATNSGVRVQIASSRTPTAMKYHLAQYAPGATAVDAEDIGRGVDAVVLAIPQEDLDDIDRDWIGSNILIDMTNRWEEEPLPTWLSARLSEGLSSSEAIAAHFGSARVVKAFNHISHWDLDAQDRRSTATPRGLGIASDHSGPASAVADLVETMNFAPVMLPSLAQGKALEPGTPVFNQPLSGPELHRSLGL